MKKYKESDWKFDDLWEDGYRFDNSKLKVWVVISRDKANNEDEALSYLLNNLPSLKINKHT